MPPIRFSVSTYYTKDYKQSQRTNICYGLYKQDSTSTKKRLILG